MHGDHIMAALALDLQTREHLKRDTVVGTVMSNFGLELALGKAGITLVRTPVGDRYLLERMLADGYNFGGEQSGHFIFLDHNTTGDGLISGLQVLSLMKRTGRPLSDLAKCMKAVPQILLNVQVKEKPDLAGLPEVQRAIRAGEAKLNGTGRVLVRYSGTEPLLRIMVEGEQESLIRSVADELAGMAAGSSSIGGTSYGPGFGDKAPAFLFGISKLAVSGIAGYFVFSRSHAAMAERFLSMLR